MKGQMRDFQERMQQGQQAPHDFQQNNTAQNQAKSSVKEGDYIDFEEIK